MNRALPITPAEIEKEIRYLTMKFFFMVLLSIVVACSTRESTPVTWRNIEQSLQTQLVTLKDGDTLNLPEGNFMFTRGLDMSSKSNVVIRGKGIEKTVLSFRNQSEGAQGFLITHGANIVLEDFSIEDARGDNLKVSEVNGITLRRIRSAWTDGPKTENGAYALYPVLCKNVLMEECLAIGSSDAGIYVGQSDSVIIRNNKAYWNVAGIESENSRWVKIYGNEAYDNTGGILVFDLPGLTMYGHTTRVYNNNVHDNNLDNFATKGNVVAGIPPGTGVMILATHNLELTENKIADNKTVGTGIISYELVAALNKEAATPGSAQRVDNQYKADSLYNPYPYQIAIHHNQFENSHWFPTLQNEIGKLFLLKSFGHPPDVAYDGIPDPKRPDAEICIRDNGDILVINLDAANDFKSLSKNPQPFHCEGVKLKL
ncbi:MAG TPA: parallel beta-helix domain-containing protein [Cyclobacteriaceae bacterium]|nr:parallel beta-helix domain-containing protein [Cyclobacteriaceae bacterium]